jgi:hypothetical protein
VPALEGERAELHRWSFADSQQSSS